KNGVPLWEKTVAGAGYSCGYSIQQLGDGGYIVAGRKGMEKDAGSEILLLKLKGTRRFEAPVLLPAAGAAVLAGLLVTFILRRRAAVGS
ncbi:MAG: hypothetical protein ACPLRU_01840, partial [Desulfofundulus sp.]